jgi:xanthine dehydrogenase/oxidase
LTGNLCRCTGYRAILEGYETFTKNGCDGCPGVNGGYCCQQKTPELIQNGTANGTDNNEVNGHPPSDDDVATSLVNSKQFAPYDESQEPIFPPELKVQQDTSLNISFVYLSSFSFPFGYLFFKLFFFVHQLNFNHSRLMILNRFFMIID